MKEFTEEVIRSKTKCRSIEIKEMKESIADITGFSIQECLNDQTSDLIISDNTDHYFLINGNPVKLTSEIPSSSYDEAYKETKKSLSNIPFRERENKDVVIFWRAIPTVEERKNGKFFTRMRFSIAEK